MSDSVPPSIAAATAAPALQCGRFVLPLARPLVMGVLNITADSFSDGGHFLDYDAALRQAQHMIDAGADLLDLGAESTRPGAAALPLDQELARILPLLKALHPLGVPLSVDTYKPAVMRAALAAGADMINDIWALRQPGALDAVRDSPCALCVMHMQGEPATMQAAPAYADVVAEVCAFLGERVAAMAQAGIGRGRMMVDPGFGFGKTVGHNYQLLAHLRASAPPGVQILAGLSRKSMLGAVTGRPAGERLAASVAVAVCAAQGGAAIIRAHDVGPTVDALRVWAAMRDAAAHPGPA